MQNRPTASPSSLRNTLLGRPRIRAGLALCTLAMVALVGPATSLAGGRADPSVNIRPVKTQKTRYPTLGKASAPITVMVFADLQCPWSKRLNTRVLQQLVKDHPNKVKVVWRDFPLAFHRQAMPAAIAAREVFRQKGNAAYWKFQALVYANMRSINDQQLAAWARTAGADSAKVLAAVQGQTHKGLVQADIAAGKAAGVRGTPSSFVFKGNVPLSSARRIKGSRKYTDFKSVVDSM